MNVTRAPLFPDLEGLARSLAYEFEFHWGYDPHKPGAERNRTELLSRGALEQAWVVLYGEHEHATPAPKMRRRGRSRVPRPPRATGELGSAGGHYRGELVPVLLPAVPDCPVPVFP